MCACVHVCVLLLLLHLLLLIIIILLYMGPVVFPRLESPLNFGS